MDDSIVHGHGDGDLDDKVHRMYRDSRASGGRDSRERATDVADDSDNEYT